MCGCGWGCGWVQYLDAPHTAAVVQGRVQLAGAPYVPDVPHVHAVVVVHACQEPRGGVKGHGHGVGVAGGPVGRRAAWKQRDLVGGGSSRVPQQLKAGERSYPCGALCVRSTPRRWGRCRVLTYCRPDEPNTLIAPSAQPQKIKSSLTTRQLAAAVCQQRQRRLIQQAFISKTNQPAARTVDHVMPRVGPRARLAVS